MSEWSPSNLFEGDGERPSLTSDWSELRTRSMNAGLFAIITNMRVRAELATCELRVTRDNQCNAPLVTHVQSLSLCRPEGESGQSIRGQLTGPGTLSVYTYVPPPLLLTQYVTPLSVTQIGSH